ncbi:MAG: hypothetical protein F9K19_01905 [Rhizobiaceae bacterium]|nr:MAG: hypothetical protein F9K19_01905 [Rhizobiaceae bacterium]
MLLKIAALLVSLSLVAERAAGRSFPARFLVLAILRRAESVATSFVAATVEAAGATADDFPWLDDSAESGASPLDAAWLALRFRLLAGVLDLCRAAGRCGDTTGNCARSGNTSGNRAGNTAGNRAPLPATPHPILPLVHPVRRTLPVHDTS